jgi:hypothetical protein
VLLPTAPWSISNSAVIIFAGIHAIVHRAIAVRIYICIRFAAAITTTTATATAINTSRCYNNNNNNNYYYYYY